MAKEKETAKEQEQPTAGTRILTAATRDDLFRQVEDLRSTIADGQTLSAGAVGRSKDDGTYSIQIDII